MNLKLRAGIIFASAFAAFGIRAFAADTFLCMRADENVAITIDENFNYKYINMTDSNGLMVYPQISTDWNTYLPFRFICEKSGLLDGDDIQGELPDGYFRYLPPSDGYGERIEITFGGQHYVHNIDEPFQYEAAPGDVRTVSIYNIRGILYAPMTYLAKITNSRALWQAESGQIMYISNNLFDYDLINTDNCHLRRDREMYLEFNYFCNNLLDSPLYMKTDGKTISDLSAEIGKKAKSVTRSRNNIYYIDENGKINIKTEDVDDSRPMQFFDSSMNECNIIADTAIVVQNKLYGVSVSAPGEKSGLLFSCDLDGKNLQYLTNTPVYNLMFKKNVLDYYLFYCDANTKSTIHMIPLNTMDDYELEITNYSHENLLTDIKQFVIAGKNLAYIDNSNLLHMIYMDYEPEEIEIMRLENWHQKIIIEAEDGESIENISQLNYDYVNEVIYLLANDSKVYYYTNKIDAFRRIHTYGEKINSLSLFNDIEYTDYTASLSESELFISKTFYNDGIVNVID